MYSIAINALWIELVGSDIPRLVQLAGQRAPLDSTANITDERGKTLASGTLAELTALYPPN